VSARVVKKLTAGRTDRRSDKALAAIRQNNGTAVARRRRNAPRPGKTLKKSQTDNSIYAGM
ncbi:hypothetical protein, partial [Klebsiella aerogenes]|uniref:hypothetical protein n=1 Tax=Klebsiella aerogenes TaxID=548 RepID=UPI001D0CF976